MRSVFQKLDVVSVDRLGAQLLVLCEAFRVTLPIPGRVLQLPRSCWIDSQHVDFVYQTFLV